MGWWNHRVRPSGASVTITRVSTRQPYATKQTSVLQGRLQWLPPLRRVDASPSPAPAAHGARSLPLPESLLTHFAWPSGQCQRAAPLPFFLFMWANTVPHVELVFFLSVPFSAAAVPKAFWMQMQCQYVFTLRDFFWLLFFHIVWVGSVELWTWVPLFWALVNVAVTVRCAPKQLYRDHLAELVLVRLLASCGAVHLWYERNPIMIQLKCCKYGALLE